MSDDDGKARQRIAEELFESVTIPIYSGHHLRLKTDRTVTLCGRNIEQAFPVRRDDGQPHKGCLAPAFALVDEEANRRMHEESNLLTPGMPAPLATPDEVEKRRGWMRRRR
jgi:hypothetical protein